MLAPDDAIGNAYAANVYKAYAFRFLFLLHFYAPVWLIYLGRERGFSLTQITALDATFFIAAVAGEIPTGAFADRWGRRQSILLGCLTWAASLTLLGIAQPYAVALLAAAGWGLSTSLISGADEALLYDSLKQIGRESEFARVKGREGVIGAGALLIAAFLGAPLASATALAAPLFATAGASIAAAAIVLSMREPPRGNDAEREPYISVVANGLRHLWHRPAVGWMVIFCGALWACTYVPLFFVQPFLERHDVPLAQFGAWQAPLRIAAMLGSLAAFRYVASLGNTRAFVVMPLAMLAAYAAIAAVDHVGMFVLFVIPHFVEGLQKPVTGAYINDRVPDERRATVLSARSLMIGLASAVLLQGGGLIADNAGLAALYAASAAACAVTAAILIAWRRADAADQAPAPAAAVTA